MKEVTQKAVQALYRGSAFEQNLAPIFEEKAEHVFDLYFIIRDLFKLEFRETETGELELIGLEFCPEEEFEPVIRTYRFTHTFYGNCIRVCDNDIEFLETATRDKIFRNSLRAWGLTEEYVYDMAEFYSEFEDRLIFATNSFFFEFKLNADSTYTFAGLEERDE